jgi:Protein of unknown function (DUF2848)
LNRLNLIVESKSGSRNLEFKVRRIINAGYVGRNQEEVQKHVEELKREGIPAPASTPTAYPVMTSMITTSGSIEVVGYETSGEGEFVLFIHGQDIYVGVGSDHTDRELEAVSILKSKQLCFNVASASVWPFGEVIDHWDELVLTSWVKEAGKKVLYQQTQLSAILAPSVLIDFVRSKVKDQNLDSTIIFSGTVAILTPEINYGDYFEVVLEDHVMNRSLSCSYSVERLEYLLA